MPTQVRINGGLAPSGPWLQSEPKDMSNPEIQWYTWGFEKNATFAVKAQPSGSGPANVTVRGQACADAVCKNIDVTLAVSDRRQVFRGAGYGLPQTDPWHSAIAPLSS